jgi:hypothetical protein
MRDVLLLFQRFLRLILKLFILSEKKIKITE